jgi:hypothetical protein
VGVEGACRFLVASSSPARVPHHHGVLRLPCVAPLRCALRMWTPRLALPSSGTRPSPSPASSDSRCGSRVGVPTKALVHPASASCLRRWLPHTTRPWSRFAVSGYGCRLASLWVPGRVLAVCEGGGCDTSPRPACVLVSSCSVCCCWCCCFLCFCLCQGGADEAITELVSKADA